MFAHHQQDAQKLIINGRIWKTLLAFGKPYSFFLANFLFSLQIAKPFGKPYSLQISHLTHN